MTNETIDEIKASVKAWIVQACKEVVFDTCLGFLFTLWQNYPWMNFSFFGDEVAEEVKQYAAEVAENAEISILPDLFEIASPVAHIEVQPARAVEA